MNRKYKPRTVLSTKNVSFQVTWFHKVPTAECVCLLLLYERSRRLPWWTLSVCLQHSEGPHWQQRSGLCCRSGLRKFQSTFWCFSSTVKTFCTHILSAQVRVRYLNVFFIGWQEVLPAGVGQQRDGVQQGLQFQCQCWCNQPSYQGEWSHTQKPLSGVSGMNVEDHVGVNGIIGPFEPSGLQTTAPQTGEITQSKRGRCSQSHSYYCVWPLVCYDQHSENECFHLNVLSIVPPWTQHFKLMTHALDWIWQTYTTHKRI